MLALAALQRAIKLDSSAPAAYYVLGQLNSIRGSFEEARAAFRKALAIEPCDYHALYHLALSERALGDVTQAERHLLTAKAVLLCGRWSFAPALLELAKIQLDSSEFAAALENANQSLSMADRSGLPEAAVNALVLRGKLHRQLSDSSLAEQDWRLAIERDRYCSDAWYQLGLLYVAQGERGKASEAMKHFREIRDAL